MKIVNIKNSEILNDAKLKSKFISVYKENLNIECNILTKDFYLDSINFFPLTEENNSFLDVFAWGDLLKYNNFYSEKFFKNYQKNIKNFKSFSNIYILGSNSFDNYYSNIVNFLPRIFFIKEKKIKLAIHRNSSIKFRNFIKFLCDKMNIDLQFVFLDDGFYKFTNSLIPQFINKIDSIKILNSLKGGKFLEKKNIYIMRRNENFRNIVNETDIISKLKKLNFKIVDLNQLEIVDQIKIFSNAKCIISATGSGLANIVFCNPGTRIIEISPKYKYEYEDHLKKRYSNIASNLSLNYTSIQAESVEVQKIDNITLNRISSKVIKESNYYKDLILRLEKFDKTLESLTV
jgi:hypothetical protein